MFPLGVVGLGHPSAEISATSILDETVRERNGDLADVLVSDGGQSES